MNESEMHYIVYTKILGLLKDLVDENGDYISNSSVKNFEIFRVWQARPRGEFRHQYLRERFIESRDLYICVRQFGAMYHILSENRKQKVITIFEQDIEAVFGKSSVDTIRDTLKKFYKVKTRRRSGVRQYDASPGRYGDIGDFTKTPRV